GPAPAMAHLIIVAEANGNSDHSNAMAPVTKGAAALVPPKVSNAPWAPRLVMFSPGALNPCLPMELPRLDWATGRPLLSDATTGITKRWRVMIELPTVP